MGLNGGGYTFLSPRAIAVLTNAEVQAMVTDHESVLFRARRCNGNQPFSVLKQLPQYASTPLFIALSTNANYETPANAGSAAIGTPYLYFGFLSPAESTVGATNGLQSNGRSITFPNCPPLNPSSYFALFPNFREVQPSDNELSPTTGLSTAAWPLLDTLIGTLLPNPSTRLMPPEFYMFLETQFGGCGWYTQTDSRLVGKCILGAQIGFR